MVTGMFTMKKDEDGTDVIWFDPTLKGTKNYQGGFNSSEPVSIVLV